MARFVEWASVLSPEVAATTLSGLRPRPLPPEERRARVARHELETAEAQLRAARRAEEEWRGCDEGRQTLALEVLAATVPTEIARIADALERQVVGFPVEP